jgi:hypothetical protein
MIRKAIVVLAALSFATTAALAAGVNGAYTSKDKTKTYITHPGTGVYTPAAKPPKNDNVIFSNIGTKYPNGLYFCCYGDTISGPNSLIGETIGLAASFTPAADATVHRIDTGVGWVSGTNEVIISLYDDNGGVPGNLLMSGAASNLGTFGDCCTLASLHTGGIAVQGGHTYWVTVTTDDTDADTWAAWPFNSTDQVNAVTIAGWDGSSWTNFGGSIPGPSLAVYGK